MFEKLVEGVNADKAELKALETCQAEARKANGNLLSLLSDNANRSSTVALFKDALDEINGDFRHSRTTPLEDKHQTALLNFLVKGPKLFKAFVKAHKAIDKNLDSWKEPIKLAFDTLDEAYVRMVKNKKAPIKADKHLDDPAGVVRDFLDNVKPEAEKQLEDMGKAGKALAALVKGLKVDDQFPKVKKLIKAVG